MSKYEFHDTVPSNLDEYYLPPEAMFIGESPIEDMVDGFMTLNVSGRELLAQTLTTQKVVNSDGQIVTGSNYPERTIEVTYRLSAKNDYEFREKFNHLNYVLSGKEFEFYFKDDPLFSYTGTVTGVGNFPVATNVGTSTITLTCSNPFKHRRQPVVNKGIGSVQIVEQTFFGVVPDRFDLVIKQVTNQILINNLDKTIRLVGNFKAGDKLTILPEKGLIYLNGVQHLELHDMFSDLENFEVSQSNKITVTPSNTEVSVSVRSKSL